MVKPKTAKAKKKAATAGQTPIAAKRVGSPETLLERLRTFLEQAQAITSLEGYRDLRVLRNTDEARSMDSIVQEFAGAIEAARRIPQLERLFSKPWPEEAHAVLPSAEPAKDAAAIWGTVLAWAALRALGTLLRPGAPDRGAAKAFDQLRLRQPMAAAFSELGWTGEQRWQAAARVRATFAHTYFADGARGMPSAASGPFTWLHDPDVAWLIGVHSYQDEQFLVKEPFESFLWWMALPSLLRLAEPQVADREAVSSLERQLEQSTRAAADAGYRVEALLSLPSPAQK